MKKRVMNSIVLLSLLLCFGFILFVGCDTGTSSDADETETPIENPTDNSTDDQSGDSADDQTDDSADDQSIMSPEIRTQKTV